MADWIYILECENGIIYVGTTNRLFRRILEHKSNKGGSKITYKYKPIKLIGLYRSNGYKFEKKEHYEEYLTLHMIFIRKYLLKNIHSKVYGGKHTSEDKHYNPIIKTKFTPSRPNCKCNLPCDVDMYHYICGISTKWKELEEFLEIVKI